MFARILILTSGKARHGVAASSATTKAFHREVREGRKGKTKKLNRRRRGGTQRTRFQLVIDESFPTTGSEQGSTTGAARALQMVHDQAILNNP
jgi:hypothetical protein